MRATAAAVRRKVAGLTADDGIHGCPAPGYSCFKDMGKGYLCRKVKGEPRVNELTPGPVYSIPKPPIY
jgi:hypothetical protein